MSIWCSHETIGWDDFGQRGRWNGGRVRSYANGSNHYPNNSGKVERRAAVDTAHIPAWCVPGHWDHEPEGWHRLGPWLRLSVDTWEHDWHSPKDVLNAVHASVVMDEAAVRALVADLTEWLDTPKVHPVKARRDTP